MEYNRTVNRTPLCRYGCTSQDVILSTPKDKYAYMRTHKLPAA